MILNGIQTTYGELAERKENTSKNGGQDTEDSKMRFEQRQTFYKKYKPIRQIDPNKRSIYKPSKTSTKMYKDTIKLKKNRKIKGT